MFILRDLLPPLQGGFSDTRLGRERAQWFTYTYYGRRTLYFVDDLESVANPADAVRIIRKSATVLYLHGLAEFALESAVAGALGLDSGAFDRWARGGGAG